MPTRLASGPAFAEPRLDGLHDAPLEPRGSPDLVGLYLSPPERALVPCGDEKSPIQALDRSQPLLPMRPGPVGRRTRDCKRHGTTSLFAALDIATGAVIGHCYPKHRSSECKKVLDRIEEAVPADLDVHLVTDNDATPRPSRSGTGWPSGRAGMRTSPRPAHRGSIRPNASSP